MESLSDAEEAVRQGRAIMIFTIVTIIFVSVGSMAVGILGHVDIVDSKMFRQSYHCHLCRAYSG